MIERVVSPLSRSITQGKDTIQVHIYRGDPGKWILEVADEFGNSTVRDAPFDSDQLALDEVTSTIASEGMASLIGSPTDS
ncbi:MAG: hypothetical protein JSS24_14185 [Proteobacteria bacterium]|nr:hypothetical protein [Pseudomonadota bacterium]